AHRIAVAGAFRDVELVGEDLDAPAEERAQAAGLADALEAQAVQPVGEVLETVDVAAGQALDGRDLRRQRPQRLERHLAAIREEAVPVLAGLDDDDLVRPLQSGLAPWLDTQRQESVRLRREAQGLVRVRKLDAQTPALNRRDPAGAELGVKSMGDAVAGFPHGRGIVPPALLTASPPPSPPHPPSSRTAPAPTPLHPPADRRQRPSRRRTVQ